MPPLVSVVIPCFNAAPMLEPALRSVIEQSYANIEIIFVDNNSSDGSVEVAKAIAAESPRPIRIAHCPEQGCNYPRNFGYGLAQGDYIQWLDADDALDREKIERQVDALERDPGAAIAYCDWVAARHHPDGRRFDRAMTLKQVDDQLLRVISGIWYPPHVYLLRRAAADALQAERAWLPGRRVCTDVEYSAIAAMLGMRFLHVDGARVQYNRWSPTQLSGGSTRYDVLIAAYREIYGRLGELAQRPEIAPRITAQHRTLLGQNWDVWAAPPGSIEICEITSRLCELRHVASGHTTQVEPREATVAKTILAVGQSKAIAHQALLIGRLEPSLGNDYPFIVATLERFRREGMLTPADVAAAQAWDESREILAAMDASPAQDARPRERRQVRTRPIAVPRSGVEGIGWPAIASGPASMLLAVQHQLEATQWWPEPVLERHQFQALRRLLAHAHATVPFYAAPLKAAGYRPAQEITAEFWRRLPILTRRKAASSGDALLSTAVPQQHGKLHQGQTSRSTDVPLRFVSTDMANLMWQAFTLREELWHGRDFSLKLASIMPGLETVAPYPDGHGRADWGPPVATVYPTGPVALLDITATPVEQAEWLIREKPAFLLSLPSNLRKLVRFFRANKLVLQGLRGLRTEGELVDLDLRRHCRDAWAVGIADIYATRETGHIALQCPEHEHYHVQSESALVEVVNDRNEACGAGEQGRVVVTSLHNYAMPLIRYETGDIAEVGAPCPCGRGLPVLTRIVERHSPSAFAG